MKKILITNDDGINSDGIVRLARAAAKHGEVWVIAPKTQCSAMSRRVTLFDTIDVHKVDFPVEGVHAYAATGTPTDCIRFGILNIVKEKPDVVLSGINFGYNCGRDMQYSATVAAALEGASEEIHSIALSEGADGVHEVTDKYLDEMLEKLLNAPLEKGKIWNINFPECPLSEFKGVLENRFVSFNGFYIDHFMEENLEDGGVRLTVKGIYTTESEEGSDLKACVDHCISIGTVGAIR